MDYDPTKKGALDTLTSIMESMDKIKQLKVAGEVYEKAKWVHDIVSMHELTDRYTIVPKQGIELYSDDELLAEIKKRFNRCCVPMA